MRENHRLRFFKQLMQNGMNHRLDFPSVITDWYKSLLRMLFVLQYNILLCTQYSKDI